MPKDKILLCFVYFLFISTVSSHISYAVGLILFNNTESIIKVKEGKLQESPTSGQEVGPGQLLIFQDYPPNDQIGFYAKATFLGYEYKKLLFGFQYFWYKLPELYKQNQNILVVLFPACEEGYLVTTTYIGFSAHRISKFEDTAYADILNFDSYLTDVTVKIRLFKPVITNLEERAGNNDINVYGLQKVLKKLLDIILFSKKNLKEMGDCPQKLDMLRDEYWQEVLKLEEKNKKQYFCSQEIAKLDLIKNDKMLEVMKDNSQLLIKKLSDLLSKVQELESGYLKKLELIDFEKESTLRQTHGRRPQLDEETEEEKKKRIKWERRVSYYNQHKTWEGYESESEGDENEYQWN